MVQNIFLNIRSRSHATPSDLLEEKLIVYFYKNITFKGSLKKTFLYTG